MQASGQRVRRPFQEHLNDGHGDQSLWVHLNPFLRGPCLKDPPPVPFLSDPGGLSHKAADRGLLGLPHAAGGCSVNYRVLCPRGTAMVHCSSLVPGDCTSYPKSGHNSPTLSPPAGPPHTRAPSAASSLVFLTPVSSR